MLDDFRQRVEAFLETVGEAVMHGAQRLGRDFRGGEIRRPFQTDGEGMQSRPPGFALVAVLDAAAGEARGAGRDQRGIEPARQQHAVGHVAHQLAMHRGFEGLAQFACLHLHAGGGVVVAPGAFVVAMQLAVGAVEIMSRRELGHVVADPHQRLHFRRHPHAAVGIVAPVQRTHADGVAGDDETGRGAIPEHEGENTVEAIEPRADVAALAGLAFRIQRIDDFAVGARLERVRLAQCAFQRAMVVDLAVHREGEIAVLGMQRLRATGGIDDREALMHQQRVRLHVHAGPVGAAMSLPRGKRQRERSQRAEIGAGTKIENAENRTHRYISLRIVWRRKQKTRAYGAGFWELGLFRSAMPVRRPASCMHDYSQYYCCD